MNTTIDTPTDEFGVAVADSWASVAAETMIDIINASQYATGAPTTPEEAAALAAASDELAELCSSWEVNPTVVAPGVIAVAGLALDEDGSRVGAAFHLGALGVRKIVTVHRADGTVDTVNDALIPARTVVGRDLLFEVQ